MTVPDAGGEPPRKIALVLAGGGARGAYEMGVLRELLPWLAKRLAQEPGWPDDIDPETWRPHIVVGTSVGALNATYLAATADERLQTALDDGCKIWQEITWGKAVRDLVSVSSLSSGLSTILDAANVPGFHAGRLLDPTPLRKTLMDAIPFERIHRNVRTMKELEAAACVTTLASTSLSRVFYDGRRLAPPLEDDRRGIQYVDTELGVEHVLASAAIPSVFPPVEVAGEWYYDGGTRLNTPIKPAIDLGATHVIVVSLHSLRLGDVPPVAQKPELLDGAKQLIQGLLVDPLVNDLHTLADINSLLGTQPGHRIDIPPDPPARPKRKTYRVIPYIVVAPGLREIGKRAVEVFNDHYRGLRDRYDNVAMLGRRLDLDNDSSRGELFSYLFFDKHFGSALVELGGEDATKWTERVVAGAPLWQTGPPA
jgi:NTE family protein